MLRYRHGKIFIKLANMSAVIVLLLGLLPTQFAFADGDKLYVTPASSQMNVGTSFTVNVGSFAAADLSTGSVSGTLLYTTSLLQVTSISVGSSAYTGLSPTQGTGTISFNGTRTPAPSGIAQVFAVTFQSIGAGTATVGFSGSSQVNSDAATSYSTSSFTITPNPIPPPSPTPTTHPKASTSPAPVVTTPVTTNPTPANTDATIVTPDPSGVVSDVIVTPSYTSAKITWKVNATSPTSLLTYGADSVTLTKQGVVTKQADGSFSSTITGLTPGQKYYFSITGGGSNVTTGTYSSTIPTQGYPVVINVTENNVAADGAQIQIGTTSYTTQSNGQLSIGLPAGSYSGKITTNTATLNVNLTVGDKTIPSDGSAPPVQSFGFNLSSSVLNSGPGSGFSIFSFLGVLFGGTIVLVFGFLIFINLRRHKFDKVTDSYQMSTGPSVIVQDDYSWQQENTSHPGVPEIPVPLVPTVQEVPKHTNSVYLTEEEPLDMFEQAKLHQAIVPTVRVEPVTPQIPNLPHSTTP